MRFIAYLLVLWFSWGFGGPALAAHWSFSELIVDQEPLASYRVNEIAVGDIDGDGRPDIWLSGRDGPGHQAAWYRNPGRRGQPWTRFTFLEGSWKYGALGDLDGDGDLDIVAGLNEDEQIYWLENGGDPEKGGWIQHPIGLSGVPDQVLTHDISGDGRLEVILAFKDGPVQILRSRADPRAPWMLTTLAEDADGAAGASIGDVDDDGHLDIVFGNAWYENPAPQEDWTAGGWTRRVIDEDWPAEARSMVADIDQDGRNDVVLSGEESEAGVALYRKVGPGTVEWHQTMVNGTVYEKVHSLAVADFNGDGRPDILAAEMHTSLHKRVTVFEQGDHPGQWSERVIATVGAHNAKIADVDGDGRPDVVGKNFEEDMRPRVWFNDFDPTAVALDEWRRQIIEAELPHRATFVRAGDLNGDGLPDLAAGAWWWHNPGRMGEPWQRREIGGGLQNVAIMYDLDGDGDLDLLGTDGTPEGDAFFWAENNGSGQFTVHAVGPQADGDFLQGAEVGRLLDEDGVQVVLSWHDGQRTDPVKGTQWFRVPADPHEEWTWERIHNFSNEEQIDLGDIDGDGRLDIHLGTHWLRNNGDGTFTLESALSLSKGKVDRVRLADVDGDGDLDVVIGAEAADWLVWGEHPGGDGRGVWREHPISTSFRHMSLDVADLDGDGDPDLVSGEHKDRGRVVIYENDGFGALWTAHRVDRGAAPRQQTALVAWALDLIGWSKRDAWIDHHNGTQLVDLDQDGDLDIVSIGWTPPSLVIYENLSTRNPMLRAGVVP